jgi:predicted RecA/RadA family phage recombinase
MAETLRSDGKAVDVAAPADITKGDVVLANGFHGIAMASASSGETVALEIALREHEVVVPGSVSAAKGATLYLTSAGAITATAGSNRPFLKVTVAKDSNNVVWGVLLPQS